MPFDKVAGTMEDMVSVQIHEETVRRLTKQAGSWMEAAQTAEIEADGKPEPEDEPPLERCVISADGAMISLVHKQWVETRTVAIGEPQEKLSADGEREIHVGNLSYFSRLADACTFTSLSEVETRRRKVSEAREVCAVMDGADWLQRFTDKHRPDALRILDFPHAAEHVTIVLEALEQAGMQFPPHMLDRCLHILKHRGPQPLLRLADRLESDLAQQKGVNAHLDYLRKREAQMQYPEYQSSGWPIGSGMVDFVGEWHFGHKTACLASKVARRKAQIATNAVFLVAQMLVLPFANKVMVESANKNMVEARLKGPGMQRM